MENFAFFFYSLRRLKRECHDPVSLQAIVITQLVEKFPFFMKEKSQYYVQKGRAIAQVVSRRLPTAATWVQTRVWSCGIL
jgi:hypothetical protein